MGEIRLNGPYEAAFECVVKQGQKAGAGRGDRDETGAGGGDCETTSKRIAAPQIFHRLGSSSPRAVSWQGGGNFLDLLLVAEADRKKPTKRGFPHTWLRFGGLQKRSRKLTDWRGD